MLTFSTFLNRKHHTSICSNNTLVRLLNVYWLVIFYYFTKEIHLVTYIHKMGETKNQQEEITNNKLFDAILDLKSSLKKTLKVSSRSQITWKK